MSRSSLRRSSARGIRLALVFALAVATIPAGRAIAQATNEELAARCTQLGSIFDKYATRRGEGSGGPDMTRVGAGIDCAKGRYIQGIRALEELLQRNRIPYPPA